MAKMEKFLKTNDGGDEIFHQALEPGFFNKIEHQLGVDGTVFCFEKVPRKTLRSKWFGKTSWQDIEYAFNLDYRKELKEQEIKHTIKSVRRSLRGPEEATLTHMFELSANNAPPSVPYSLYNFSPSDFNGNYNLLDSNFQRYNDFRHGLQQKIETGGYTDVLVASSGWYNNQSEAFGYFKGWLDGLKAEAAKNGVRFKPYLIAITWPSYAPCWYPLDYFIKANDADEIGVTHVNRMLWESIVPAIESANVASRPFLTVISHSFGARIMSRGVNSRKFITNIANCGYPLDEPIIDNFFLLQGAVNLKRYLTFRRGEGGIYAIDIPVKNTVATSSKLDKANPVAFWSSHIGSKKTIRQIHSSRADQYVKFNLLYANANGEVNGFAGTKRYKLIDATELVREHSDVVDAEMAKLLWRFMR